MAGGRLRIVIGVRDQMTPKLNRVQRVLRGDTFREGWRAFWVEVTGQRGKRRWLGFAVASLVSALTYELLKLITQTATGWRW